MLQLPSGVARRGEVRLKILLVEDDTELAQWLIKALKQRYEFMIDWAEDGAVADNRLREEEFDVVILDLGLPSMGGRSVLSAMRLEMISLRP